MWLAQNTAARVLRSSNAITWSVFNPVYESYDFYDDHDGYDNHDGYDSYDLRESLSRGSVTPIAARRLEKPLSTITAASNILDY